MTVRTLPNYLHADKIGGEWLSVRRHIINELGIAGALCSPNTRMKNHSVYIDMNSPDGEILKMAVKRHPKYDDYIDYYYTMSYYAEPVMINRYIRNMKRYNPFDATQMNL